MMISGTTIKVLRPIDGVYDRFGNKTQNGVDAEQVDNVLIVPGASEELEAARPEGVTVAYTLHFPKSYMGSLEGCSVELPGPWEGTYRVIGSPGAYMDLNTPGNWHMPVEVEAAHG